MEFISTVPQHVMASDHFPHCSTPSFMVVFTCTLPVNAHGSPFSSKDHCLLVAALVQQP